MTPLAHRIVKQLLLPPRKRSIRDHIGLLSVMDDVHCFECTEIQPLITDLFFSENGDDSVEMLRATGEALIDGKCFLPAPKTWIEVDAAHGREGRLLVERDGWIWCALAFENDDRGTPAVAPQCWCWRIEDGRPLVFGTADRFDGTIEPSDPNSYFDTATAYTTMGKLALINTPKVIGRRQHMPSARLERKLLARRSEIGKFPLHAWTEIKLEVTRPPQDVSDDPSIEAHLTGQKAYHFCRAHLRIKNGRVEFVRSHWRGDPSLGIKRSRYVVKQ